jgi:hypothetical protein
MISIVYRTWTIIRPLRTCVDEPIRTRGPGREFASAQCSDPTPMARECFGVSRLGQAPSQLK